jgi:probable addiction module antidote protein
VPTIDYKDDFLLHELQDREHAAAYLTAALEEGEEVFLLAIRDVVEAHGGIGTLAKLTQLNRENLYAMLSETGNPRLSSLTTILATLGFEISFRPKLQGATAA